jgi:indolepyruvate ferredoxin oxidoreductase
MSIEPVATEFGRKTHIHQSSCNKDYSCVKGFCPSFMTITPTADTAVAPEAPRKKKKAVIPALTRDLPEPALKFTGDFGVHLMGIGGTGSVTVAATIAYAARLEGKHVIGLDQTGLAQKGGAVISDIKITLSPFMGANKISDGCADLYLGFDILNATDPKNLDKCHPERTIAIISTTETPTGQMVTNRHVAFPGLNGLTAGINRVSRANDNVFLDGQGLAEGLFGDSMATNLFMVGVAFQAGALPLKATSIETAIQHAGVGVEMGLAAFRWGRMAVVDRAFVQDEISKSTASASVSVLPLPPALSMSAHALVDSVVAQGELKRLLEIRVPELIAYQNIAYATRYTEVIRRITSAEKMANVGATRLSEAAARYLYKLMAYKDEYEVARLHTDPAFLAKLRAQFKAGYKAQYHLAPPLISRRDPITGELQKRAFGPWIFTAFKLLAKMKFLRGSALDIFGKTEERRHERQMIEDYIHLLDEIMPQLTPANYEAAVSLISVPDEIRGYGHVKEKSIAAAKVLQAQRLAAFHQSQPVVLAA